VTRSAVRDLAAAELEDWDAQAVDAPGGHVLQSRAWAEHRSGSGWTPLFLAVGDARAMALKRGWAGVPGGSVYLPRGPVCPSRPWRAGDPGGAHIAAALDDLANFIDREGLDVLAADPEVRADDDTYRAATTAAGYHAISGIDPAPHRMATE